MCYIVVSCADSFVSNLIVREAESVYDYCWYPYMSASGASAALCFLQIHVLDCSTHDFFTKLFQYAILLPQFPITDPTSCVFASSTRDHPIHLWDSISGQVMNK